MLHALFVLAAEVAEEAEPSKTAFYICGGALAAWAVILGLVGLKSADFPGSTSAARGIMTLTAVLMVAAMVTSVTTA